MGRYISLDGSYHEGDKIPGDRDATDPECAERAAALARATQIAEIVGRLAALDAEAIRPLRAIAAGTGTADDTAKLSALEAEAEALRVELAAL